MTRRDHIVVMATVAIATAVIVRSNRELRTPVASPAPPARVVERIQVVPRSVPAIAVPAPVVAAAAVPVEADGSTIPDALATVERARAARHLSDADLESLRRAQDTTDPVAFEPVISAIVVAINRGELALPEDRRLWLR